MAKTLPMVMIYVNFCYSQARLSTVWSAPMPVFVRKAATLQLTRIFARHNRAFQLAQFLLAARGPRVAQFPSRPIKLKFAK